MPRTTKNHTVLLFALLVLQASYDCALDIAGHADARLTQQNNGDNHDIDQQHSGIPNEHEHTGGTDVQTDSSGDNVAVPGSNEEDECAASPSTPSGPLHADKCRGEWTLVVIPDTQGYAENWQEEGYDYWKMEQTFAWIRDVREQLNIKVVQSVGDMIENHNSREWTRVQKDYYLLLDGGIPAIPCAGNHEWEGDKSFSNLNEYFQLTDFESQSWWGGHYKGMQNTYQLFDIGNEKYLFLTLQFQPGSSSVGAQDAVDWAEAMLTSDSHRDRKVILTSHWNNDQRHFEQLVEPNANVIMTLAGHKCAEEYYVSKGRTHNFVQDYQCMKGLMQIRYYKFKPNEDLVEWYTYSRVGNDGAGEFWTKSSVSQGSFHLEQKDVQRR